MMAVTFQDVVVTYRNKSRKSIKAIDHANLRVPDGGGIYGLLGPSGCGKTTSLLCCLGIIKPQQGQVQIFGQKPGSKNLGIPGSNVGYMPQSSALHSYFTCKEILRYYCCIHGLKGPEVEEKSIFLLKTLGIQDKLNVLVICLSEGQRRRVSLACAIIHQPKLLLLDEPTVGVDPLLRQAIWLQLQKMVEDHKTTILISTHYIQEAEAANCVAFMRSGQILAEGSPAQLTAQLNAQSLEDVFYKICISSKEDSDQQLSSVRTSYADSSSEPQIQNGESFQNFQRSVFQRNVFQRSVFQALLSKNLAVCRRHLTFMLFFVALPLVTFSIFMQCIGPPPKGLHLGLFNEESNCSFEAELKCDRNKDWTQLLWSDFVPWQGSSLSCDVLRRMAEEGTVSIFNPKSNLQEGIAGVQLGNEIGIVHVHKDFSVKLWSRIKSLATGIEIDNVTLAHSVFSIRMDSTNQVLENSVKKSILESLQSTLLDVFGRCGFPDLAKQYLKLGVTFTPAFQDSLSIPEEENSNLSYNMLPGLIILVLHFGAVGLTADHLVTEKEEGILERDMSSGITIVQLLLAQMLTQCLVVVPEVIASMIFMVYVGNYSLHASTIILLGILCLLQSITGMAFGILLTAACPTRDQAIQAGVGLIMPEFLFSGILWPSVAMPRFFKILGDLLPLTLSCELARNLVHQSSARPILGIFMPIFWIAAFMSVSCWMLNRKLRNR